MIAPTFASRTRRRGRLPVFLLVCLLAGISPGALGAVINVDTLEDVVDGSDSLCSLREAVDNANDDAQTHADCAAGTGDDTIQLAQTQDMYDALTGDLELTGAELIVNDAGGTAGESLTVDGRVTDPSSSDNPPPERTLTIDGGGDSEADASACLTSENRTGRILSIQTPTTLTGLTVQNACIQDLDGGLIFNASALTLTDVDAIAGNALGDEANGGGRGGAIFNNTGATLVINGSSQLSSNFASRAGGGIASVSTATVGGGCPLAIVTDCTISLDGVTLSSNLAGFNDTADGGSGTLLLGSGGGLHNGGGIVAGQSVAIDSNLATVSGGGIWNSGPVTLRSATIQSNQAQALALTLEDQTPRGGGAIFNNGGDLDLTFATISGNSVVHNDVLQTIVFPAVYGGAIASIGDGDEDIRLDTVAMTQNQAGQAQATNDSNEVVQPLIPGLGGAIYTEAGTLTIVDSTLFNNVAQTDGGAIWHGADSLDIQHTTVQNNQARGEDEEGTTATGGGGLYNDGPATILGGRFYGNAANGENGAGGAIIHAGGSLSVTDTEIGRNFATFGAGIDNASTLTLDRVFLGAPQIESRNIVNNNGGGLHNRDGATATIDKSALAFNDARNGGGIWNAGTLSVTNTTLSNNRALNGGRGAGLFQSQGNATLRYTTLVTGGVAAAGGADVAAESSLITGAASGSVNGDGFSLINPANPSVRGLQLYGGPTPTRPLNADSPATNNGNTGDCPPTDQREATRPSGGNCDTGSFERTNDPVLTVTNNSVVQTTVESGEDLVVLAFSVTNDGDESVTVGGFDMLPLFNGGVEALRRLVGNDPDAVDPLQFEVVLDNGAGENAGNGLLDADETTVVGSGDRRSLNCIEVECSIGPAGGSKDYLIVLRLSAITTTSLSFAPPLLAGGLLIGLLGLVRLRGVRRRVQWSFVALLLAVGLAACSESSNIDELEPPAPPVPDPSLQGQLRFKLYQLESTVAGDILIGEGLPVYGPAISVP